jgi:hypothetical protein
MLTLAGKPDADVAGALKDGRAMDKWRAMISAQGGDPNAKLPVAKESQTVNATSTSFTFRANSTISFAANGTATFTPPSVHAGGTNTLALTGNLSEANELKFIIIPAANVNAVNVTSTSVSVNTTSNVVIGNTATFSNNFVIGDYIRVFNTSTNDFRRVTSIVNTTAVSVDANLSFVNAAASICRAYVAGIPVSLLREDSANVMIANTTSGSINLGTTLTSTMSATLYYDSTRTSAAAASKVINKNRFVKIAANTHPNRNTGLEGSINALTNDILDFYTKDW